MATNGSSYVWVWDPLSETADFVHPGELPNDRQVAKTRLINGVSGPFLAKITPVILAGYNQGQGLRVTKVESWVARSLFFFLRISSP